LVLSFCCACGGRDALEQHHLLPRCLGGPDDETNLLTLCNTCHGLVHGMIRRDISTLTKAGLQRARERGVILGNPNIREVRRLGTAASAARKNARKAELLPIVTALLGETGCPMLCADALNDRGITTITGIVWTARRVRDFLRTCREPS
jgi:hypothetical protein